MVLFTRSRERGAARPARSCRRRAASGLSTEWLERRQMLSGLSILEQRVVSRSESAAANPAQVVVGEIVRYRAVLSVAEGAVAESESRLTVTLPTGLAFLDDATATVAFVSDGGLAASRYASSHPAYVTGSSAVSPTAGVAAGGLVVGAGSVSFEFGTLANADADEGGEFVVLEFNLLVTNVAGSGAGTALVATSGVVVDGEQVALENLPSVTVAGGSIAGLSVTTVGPDDQTPTAGPILAGDQVRARIAFTVAAGEFAAALYAVRVAAPLPAGLALDPASLRVLVNGTEAAGVVNDSSTGGLVVTISTVAPGDAVVVLVDATIDAGAEAGVPLAVEAAVTAASLPQGTGTAPNATGSVVPGGRGAADGARDGSDGSGGLNGLAWTAAASVVPFTIDLEIAAAAGFGVHSPGGPVTYTVVVTNKSLGFVAGASVIDRVPADLADVSWRVAYAGQGSGPATGGPAAGTTFFGDIGAAIDLAAGGTATFTVTGRYTGAGGRLVNEATVAPPPGRADVKPANDRAVVETTFENRIDLAVTISDGRLTYSPGQGLTYQVTVTNAGPGIAAGTRVLAVAPAGVTAFGWTATFSAGASGSAGGIGPLDTTVTLPPGGTAVYTLVVTLAADVRGLLTTAASASAAAGLVDTALASNAASDTNRLPVVVTGAESGARSRPEVNVIDPATGAVLTRFLAYEQGFRGGVRVGLGDVDGDGLEEIVAAPGPGRVGEIRVFRLDGTELTAFRTLPFGRGWQGGVEVASGDVDGNGRDDIVAARSRGDGEVRVFLSVAAPDPIRDAAHRRIVPFGRGFNGGATVAVADVGSFAAGRLVDGMTADDRVEIVVGSGPGAPPLVRVYDVSAAPRVVATVRPFTAAVRGGVAVTSGRITGDDIDEIIVSAGRGGRGALEVYDGLLNRAPAGGLARVSAAFAALARPNSPLFLAPVDLTGNGRIDRLFATLGDPHAGAGVAAFSPTGELIGAAVGLAGPLRIAAGRPPRVAPDSDLVTTPSGLQYRELVVGTGSVPAVGQRVTAHYTGTLLDGTVFDSSRGRGEPFQFRLGQGQVIAGWDEAFATMRVGGQRILIIPPGLAYGASPPSGSSIPPNATLVFDVELLAIG